MNPEFEDLINTERYYYFIIISQISIWSIYFINLFSVNKRLIIQNEQFQLLSSL